MSEQKIERIKAILGDVNEPAANDERGRRKYRRKGMRGQRWRGSRIRAIRERCARCKLAGRTADYIAGAYGAVRLHDLTDAQLQTVHRVVARWALDF